MTTIASARGLAPVATDTPDDLRRAVEDFVDTKYLVDQLARSPRGWPVLRDLHDEGYGPMEGLSYFNAVFPFDVERQERPSFFAYVPTKRVIGCSWRWEPRHFDEAKQMQWMAHFLDESNLDKGCHRAEHIWIEPLGLFLAHEGKNRVLLFRERAEPWIPALVSPWTYPAAERIALYRVCLDGHDAIWAVLDAKYLEPLRYEALVLPILTAYGVRGVEDWPADYPPTGEIILALAYRRGQKISRKRAPLDLSALRREIQADARELRCAVLDVHGIRLHTRAVGWTLLAAFIFATTGVLASTRSEVLGLGAATGAAFLVGAVGGVCARLYRVPVRMISTSVLRRKFGIRFTRGERGGYSDHFEN